MTRTSWLGLWVVLVTAAACTGEGPRRTVEPITLTLACYPGHGFDELVAEWEREHPGVRVELKERDYRDHHDALELALTGAANSSRIDVAMVEVSMASHFHTMADRFVDLRSVGAGALKPHYLDWRWAHGVAPTGQVTGIPTDIGGLAVAYRADRFEAAGLPAGRDEVGALWPTWTDFLEVGKRFTSASGRSFIDDAGSLFEAKLNQHSLQFYSVSGDLIVADNTDVVDAWELAVAAALAGLDRGGSPAFSDGWNDRMKRGDVNVLFAPAWMLTYIQNLAPGTAGHWDITTIPGQAGNWGGSQLAIPANTQERELSWSLVQHLTSHRGQRAIFDAHGNFPAIPSLFDHPALVATTKPFFRDAPVGRIYAAAALASRPVVVGRHQRAFMDTFRQHIRKVSSGKLTAASAWREAVARIERRHVASITSEPPDQSPK